MSDPSHAPATADSSVGKGAARSDAPTAQRGNEDASARHLWDLWCQGQRPDLDEFLTQAGDLTATALVAVLQIDQRARWERGERRLSEAYLKAHPRVCDDLDAALDLVYGE